MKIAVNSLVIKDLITGLTALIAVKERTTFLFFGCNQNDRKTRFNDNRISCCVIIRDYDLSKAYLERYEIIISSTSKRVLDISCRLLQTF